MEPILSEQLRRAFAAHAARCRSDSPLCAALCSGLSAGPSPGVTAVFARYYRILSATAPNIPVMLAGLHHLALGKKASRLSAFFPSCGGAFRPEKDGEAMVSAAEGDLADYGEDVLDFMLSQEPVSDEVQLSALLLPGASAVAERFGGGLSVVELGAGAGLRLFFDRYAYRFGATDLGQSPLRIPVDIVGGAPVLERLAARGMPTVLSRRGLDDRPRDLTDPETRRVVEAFLPPDRPERIAQLRGAVACMPDRPDIRQGDLGRLLVETYNAMAPGNTLLLTEVRHWSALTDEKRRQTALTVQTLAARIQPKKPIAWLQAESFTPGAARLELRLHTFGWAHPEDRTVRKLAEAAPDGSWIRWLE